MSKWIVSVLLVLVVGLGSIAKAKTESMSPLMKELPFSQIGVYTSENGESERAFLLRIAPVLATYTHKTGWEACAMIATNGHGEFGVVLGSNHVHMGCLSGQAGIPDGMTLTGETLHSHPEKTTIMINHDDEIYERATGMKNLHQTEFHGSPKVFSIVDFSGGPGYLVASGKLLYQPGYIIPHGIFVGNVALLK